MKVRSVKDTVSFCAYKDLAFDKRVEQMIVSACQKSNSLTVETIRSA